MNRIVLSLASFHPNLYLKPTTAQEVVQILSDYKERARIIGGGTEIHELAQRGFASDIEVLVDLEGLQLNYVREEDNVVKIGGSTTFTDLLTNSTVKEEPAYGALLDALQAIRPVQVRSMATVAGAICSALPFFDLPVALCSLDAQVKIAGPQGERFSSLVDFTVGYFQVDLKEGEFVVEVDLPGNRRGLTGAFEKFALTADDWAIVSCASTLQTEKRVCREARIFVGGEVGETPRRARSAEEQLKGRNLTDDVISQAAVKVRENIDPVSDIRGSAEYRGSLAEVLVARTVSKALLRAGDFHT